MEPEDIIIKYTFEIYEDWVNRGSPEDEEIPFFHRTVPAQPALRDIRDYFNKQKQSLSILVNKKIDTPILSLEFTEIINGVLHVIIKQK